VCGQGSKVRLSRAEARQAFLEEAAKQWDVYNAWYDAHPDATFDEIDEEVGEEGRAHLGKLVGLTLRRGALAMSETPSPLPLSHGAYPYP
jgi:hypothetical protein